MKYKPLWKKPKGKTMKLWSGAALLKSKHTFMFLSRKVWPFFPWLSMLLSVFVPRWSYWNWNLSLGPNNCCWLPSLLQTLQRWNIRRPLVLWESITTSWYTKSILDMVWTIYTAVYFPLFHIASASWLNCCRSVSVLYLMGKGIPNAIIFLCHVTLA